ncbi:MAG: TonB-dependent receptor domain-containing protein [bacterium]
MAISPVAITPDWAIVDTETRDLIAEDIDDFTQLLPALFPVDHGSLGQLSPLSFRGSSPQETDIWYGPVHLENPLSSLISTADVPINLVEEMHIIDAGAFSHPEVQGPGVGLWIDPYRFEGQRPYSRVDFRAGDWGYSDLGVLFGLPVSRSLKFMFSGSRQELNGFEPERGHAGSRILGNIVFEPHQDFELNYTVLFNRHEFEIPAPLLPAFVPWSPGLSRQDKRLDQVVSLKSGRLKTRKKRFQMDLFHSAITDKSLIDSLSIEPKVNVFGARIQQERIVGKNLLAMGAELKISDLRSVHLGNRTDYRFTAYARSEYAYSQNWRAGVRLSIEKQNRFSTALRSEGHVAYSPAPGRRIWLGLKRALRYPGFVERYWPQLTFQGNPQLDVEHSSSVELGLSAQEEGFEIRSVLFASDVSDWIGNNFVAGSGQFVPENLGSRTVLGYDLKLVWKYTARGEFGFVHAYRTVPEGGSAKALDVPEFSLYSYLELGGHFFEDYVYINLRLIGRVFGERSGRVFANSASLPSFARLPEGGVLDGQISFQFSDARLSISMENLFDKRYELVPGFRMPPKTLRFGISWEFID